MLQKKALSPFQKFTQIEGLSGILLLLATLTALAWANSPWQESYVALWQYQIGFATEGFALHKPLILWINDGLMAVFFFLIGLEIKREFLIGKLNSLKKVAFPVFGALGGMLFPVLFYLLLNQNPATLKGWGVPMATDIAFSLAVLNLLGKRVPLSLKLFLTGFAIVDDIGAVLVIAVFYSGNIELAFLAGAFLLLAFLYTLSWQGYYSKFLLVSLGALTWLFFLKSGIHPTLAGILLAFAVPVRQRIHTDRFIDSLVNITDSIRNAAISKKPILSTEQIEQIDELENWIGKFQSPLQHLEHKLHDWVAYFIIPIFALANAGVILGSAKSLDWALVRNIVICLLVGNSVGITFIISLAQKLNWIEIPEDIRLQHIVGVSFLAGIGFTMAIFIAGLAFAGSPAYIDSAKIGILIGSFFSALAGYSVLRWRAALPEAA